MSVQETLIDEFFPQEREEFNKLYESSGSGKQMTRQDHIDACKFVISGVVVGRMYWNALYPDLPFEEQVFRMKPWLATDGDFARWLELEPFDRFEYLRGHKVWEQESVA